MSGAGPSEAHYLCCEDDSVARGGTPSPGNALLSIFSNNPSRRRRRVIIVEGRCWSHLPNVLPLLEVIVPRQLHFSELYPATSETPDRQKVLTNISRHCRLVKQHGPSMTNLYPLPLGTGGQAKTAVIVRSQAGWLSKQH